MKSSIDLSQPTYEKIKVTSADLSRIKDIYSENQLTGMKKSFKKTIPNCQMDHLNLILHDLRMICFSLSKST